ncbi:MAG: T9SS type A sorting domain-containing protein, partial [Flavobacterium sp.]|nr:T9SS type A sorting domain-containing protein [Flavobacterium sp.]
DFFNFVPSRSAIDSIEIFNILGQRVLWVAPAQPGEPVTISALQSGTFIVKVSTVAGTFSSKLIKL